MSSDLCWWWLSLRVGTVASSSFVVVVVVVTVTVEVAQARATTAGSRELCAGGRIEGAGEYKERVSQVWRDQELRSRRRKRMGR